MNILALIKRSHELPLAVQALQRPDRSLLSMANPIFEIKNYLRDRKVLESSSHQDVFCDNPQCKSLKLGPGHIFGLRYWCADCNPTQVNFCSDCITISGQGIHHDPAHRLVQLQPTTCALCQGLEQLEEQPANFFRIECKEYSTTGAALKRVGEYRSCGLCAFVWALLNQAPPHNIKWPPGDDQEITIRARVPWSAWLELAVVSDAAEDKEIDINGRKYKSSQQSVSAQESALLVGYGISKTSIIHAYFHIINLIAQNGLMSYQ